MLIDPYTWHRVAIVDRLLESTEAVSIRVDMPTAYHFHAGQHAVVRVTLPDKRTVMRQYSYSSAPGSGELWFTIILTPGGIVSSWFLRHALPGTTIDISQPLTGPLVGDTTLHPRVCMIAGGSGIAPIMSHVRERRSARTLPGTLHLLYSTRSTQICYRNELKPQRNEIVITRSTDQEDRFTSHEITSHAHGADRILICGSRQFVIAIRQMVATVVDTGLIHSEAFSLD